MSLLPSDSLSGQRTGSDTPDDSEKGALTVTESLLGLQVASVVVLPKFADGVGGVSVTEDASSPGLSVRLLAAHFDPSLLIDPSAMNVENGHRLSLVSTVRTAPPCASRSRKKDMRLQKNIKRLDLSKPACASVSVLLLVGKLIR